MRMRRLEGVSPEMSEIVDQVDDCFSLEWLGHGHLATQDIVCDVESLEKILLPLARMTVVQYCRCGIEKSLHTSYATILRWEGMCEAFTLKRTVYHYEEMADVSDNE